MAKPLTVNIHLKVDDIVPPSITPLDMSSVVQQVRGLMLKPVPYAYQFALLEALAMARSVFHTKPICYMGYVFNDGLCTSNKNPTCKAGTVLIGN
ncbi:hypothetical protein N7507_007164 [Penicillium longicatenatum]|nr:hypothetical protein N7507_007164 [Penicillium longicatenatum]